MADSWIPPTKEVLESADHSTRLTVTPRDPSSPVAYFEDKVAGREPAGALSVSKATSAGAVLEIRNASGQWVTSWNKPLVNEIAPVDVLVANGGRGVVTFDNWHSMGYGPNTIVVYGSQGNLVRALALEDVFPKWFVAAQPHSVSSIWWRGQPHISDDGTAAVVPIKLPSQSSTGSDGPTLDLLVRLSDGETVGLTEQPWKAALVEAARTAGQMCRAERDYLTKWNAPIAAPTEWVEPAWHDYLREIVYRSAPNWNVDPGPVVDTTVLRPPSAPDFRPSLVWLKGALTEKTVIPDLDVRAIGSPDYERLTKEIENDAPRINVGRLRGVELIVVVDEDHSARVRAALSRSGANIRIVNPLVRISQRPDRMRKIDTSELPVCQVPSIAPAASD